MKKIYNYFVSALVFLSALGLKGAEVSLSNFDGGGSGALPIVDSTGTLLGSSSTAAIGFFTDEAAVALGDFSSFNQFGGDLNFASVAANNIEGLIAGDYSEDILSGSNFIGEEITLFVRNSTDSEWLVARTERVFAEDAPIFSSSINLFNDSDITYLFGGVPGPSIDYSAQGLTGLQSSISTSPVPEPSTYALFAGVLILGYSVIRRSRVEG